MILNLQNAEAQGRLDRKMRTYTRFPLLVIDEIGYLPLDQDGANLLFRVVAARYENASMVFTSNKSFSEWGEILGDSVLATAILDRILHHCRVVNITGKSYRLKDRKRLGLPAGSAKGGGRKS